MGRAGVDGALHGSSGHNVSGERRASVVGDEGAVGDRGLSESRNGECRCGTQTR